MATGAPDPVETWAPVFTKHLRDEQILAPTYALTREGNGTWCKLCDDSVPKREGDAAHMRKHRADLKAWRGRSRKENERAAKARLAEARKERQRMRELGMLEDRASTDGNGQAAGGAAPRASSRRSTVGHSGSAAKGGTMKSSTETAGAAASKPAGADLFKGLLARIRAAKIGKEVIVKDDQAYARVMLDDKRNAGYVVVGKTKLNVYPQAMASDMPKAVSFKKVKLGSHHFGRGEVIVPVESEDDFATAVAALEAAAKLPAPERKTAAKPAGKAPEKAAAKTAEEPKKRRSQRAAARNGGRRKAGAAASGK